MRKYYFVFLLILFLTPPCKTNNPKPQNLNSLQLSILTYNVWALPISLYNHNQDFRFPKIPKHVENINADIICLQETFHPKIRKQLINNLTSSYQTKSQYLCNKIIIPFIVKDCQGGLMTFSKYPILSETFYMFPKNKEYNIIEHIGSKGFLITKINANGFIMYVINTHLYSGNNDHAEKIRMDQISYINKITFEITKNDKYPVFLVGDININHPNVDYSPTYDKILKTFNDTEYTVDETDFTSDGLTNHYVPNHECRSKIDYIFYNERNCSIKVVESKRCLDEKPYLSDHFGWISHIQLVK
jgi:endonuclease/exonuclease/phosphatase family metal-dependent hydrolase